MDRPFLELRRDLARLEGKLDALAERNEDRFDQVERSLTELFGVLREEFAALRRDLEAVKRHG